MFDVVWGGKRHVMMGATQVDRYGNQNIAALGDPAKPKVQLLGFRGAPGNTVCNTTSYFVPNHSPKVFVEEVDLVTGIGWDRGCHEVRRVVSNLGTFDFATDDNRMRLRTIHPGVTVEEVQEATGFELVVDDDLDETRAPTDEELRLIREVLDPDGLREAEVRS
jgi:acyl CoA:acetate/3-ketoacid CoA transferase beta subunit